MRLARPVRARRRCRQRRGRGPWVPSVVKPGRDDQTRTQNLVAGGHLSRSSRDLPRQDAEHSVCQAGQSRQKAESTSRRQRQARSLFG